MDSNKKRKRAANEPNEERDRYYKKLRREQNKRRQKRKKGLGPKEESDARPPRGNDAGKADCGQKLKKLLNVDKALLPRGRILVSAALEKASRKVERHRRKRNHVPHRPPQKSNNDQRDLKEIKASSLKRDEGKLAIVLLKEFKQRSNTSIERLRQEAAYEARVVQQLEDHPGIPLLFGVMLQQPSVVAIVFQFHGEDEKSLTLYKAAKEKSGIEFCEKWQRH